MTGCKNGEGKGSLPKVAMAEVRWMTRGKMICPISIPSKMPNGSSEILTAKRCSAFKLQRLQAAEGAAESPQMNSAAGRLTYMDAYQQQQVALHAQRKLKSQVAAIRSALQRVQKGTYGICEGCGRAIPPERLEFMPEAAFCVNCHQSRSR